MTRAMALVLVGGCRSIIGIEDVTVDQAIDNDEDSDSFVDFDDNCPNVANEAQKDSDGDGVGDECDPSSIADNRIALYTPLLDDFGVTLGPNVVIGDGYAAIRSSQITLTQSYRPVRIEVRLVFRTFLSGQALGIELDGGGVSQWSCYAGFLISACEGNDCLRLTRPQQNTVFTRFDQTELLTNLAIDTPPSGVQTCIGNAGLLRETAAGVGQIPADVTVSFLATGDVELHDIIVYE
jgi:hypothetical protein